jgi:hypothetical protein
MMFGLASFGLSMWAFSYITSDWSGGELLVPQVLRGFPQAIPDRAFSGPVAVALTVPLYRRHPTVGIHQFSPVNRGSCSEQSITSRRMFFQRSPVSGTKQRLGRQNACSGAPGNSFGADEFGDGHAIVIRHSSLPLRGRRGACGRIGVRERQNE